MSKAITGTLRAAILMQADASLKQLDPEVTIVGETKPQHLADAIAALDIELTPDEVERLEAPYTARQNSGF